MLMWSPWIVSRFSWGSPMMADSPGTTWSISIRVRPSCCTYVDIHTFPIPVRASSSAKDQMASVRLSKIQLSPIRSRVCKSLSRSRIKSRCGFCKATWATEAATFAIEFMSLPLWGVPRKIMPLVTEKI